jgi:hypothetical protein
MNGFVFIFFKKFFIFIIKGDIGVGENKSDYRYFNPTKVIFENGIKIKNVFSTKNCYGSFFYSSLIFFFFFNF